MFGENYGFQLTDGTLTYLAPANLQYYGTNADKSAYYWGTTTSTDPGTAVLFGTQSPEAASMVSGGWTKNTPCQKLYSSGASATDSKWTIPSAQQWITFLNDAYDNKSLIKPDKVDGVLKGVWIIANQADNSKRVYFPNVKYWCSSAPTSYSGQYYTSLELWMKNGNEKVAKETSPPKPPNTTSDTCNRNKRKKHMKATQNMPPC